MGTFLVSCLIWGRNGACPLFLLVCVACGVGEARHLVYVHGRIVQVEQSRRPLHPQFGYYELDSILDTFRGQGFVVHSEIRPQTIDESDAADHLVAEVRKLLDSGVRPDSITVVGASMGASITLLASTRLDQPDVRFAVLGACLTENTRWLDREEHKRPRGRILAIRDASDDLDGPCTAFSDDADARDGLIAREIVIDTGLSHGFLYRPLPEWVEPVVQFAQAREAR